MFFVFLGPENDPGPCKFWSPGCCPLVFAAGRPSRSEPLAVVQRRLVARWAASCSQLARPGGQTRAALLGCLARAIQVDHANALAGQRLALCTRGLSTTSTSDASCIIVEPRGPRVKHRNFGDRHPALVEQVVCSRNRLRTFFSKTFLKNKQGGLVSFVSLFLCIRHTKSAVCFLKRTPSLYYILL